MGAPASAVPDIRGSSPAPPLRRRPGRGAQLLAVGAGIGLAATLALVPGSEQPGALSAGGEVLIALGRLCGLAGAYALLISVLLVARLAPLERAVEHPQLVRWHRRLAPWTLLLIAAHGALVAGGLCAAGADGPAARAVAAHHHLPRRSRGHGRLSAARRRRRDVLPAVAPPHGL